MAEKDKKTEQKKKAGKKIDVFYSGTGRRKTSVARVWLYPEGHKDFKGIIVNEKPIAEYFPGEKSRAAYMEPIFACALPSLRIAVSIKVHGGGSNSQLGAVRHGLARAILSIDEKAKVETPLGILDARLDFIPEAKVGDYITVHYDFGCEVITKEKAEELEKNFLTALLCKLTDNQPSDVCAEVKDLVEQV